MREHARFDSTSAFASPSARTEHPSARSSDAASQRGTRRRVVCASFSARKTRFATASSSLVCASTPDLTQHVYSGARALGQSTRLLAAATPRRSAARVKKCEMGGIRAIPPPDLQNASSSRVCASAPDLIRRVHSPRRALDQCTRLLAAATRHRSAARVDASFSAPFRPEKRDLRPRAARECVRARPIRIVQCILVLEH